MSPVTRAIAATCPSVYGAGRPICSRRARSWPCHAAAASSYGRIGKRCVNHVPQVGFERATALASGEASATVGELVPHRCCDRALVTVLVELPDDPSCSGTWTPERRRWSCPGGSGASQRYPAPEARVSEGLTEAFVEADVGQSGASRGRPCRHPRTAAVRPEAARTAAGTRQSRLLFRDASAQSPCPASAWSTMAGRLIPRLRDRVSLRHASMYIRCTLAQIAAARHRLGADGSCLRPWPNAGGLAV